MKSLLAAGALAAGVLVFLLAPVDGAGALVLCLLLSAVVCLLLSRVGEGRDFLLQVFIAGLLVRVLVGTLIYNFGLYDFFGGDAITYDFLGVHMLKVWTGELPYAIFHRTLGMFVYRNWGMIYVVAAIYAGVGQNTLAVQFVSAVLGAATAPVIFLCARHIYNSERVARWSALFVAFFPSLILWSSQGLKDGPLVFLLAVAMLATLKLSDRLSLKYLLILGAALLGIFTLRFYIFYMMLLVIVGSYIIGIKPVNFRTLARNFIILVALSLVMLQAGVLRSAGVQLGAYGSLEAVQRSRLDMATSAKSGFEQDVDVSTTSGALSAIPVGLVYLLFAPFPWQLASLRQSITLPEMVVWWASFPMLVTGLWFTLRYRVRQALPILLFTTMLTLAYSVFQGNVGTAYRQRSQLLIFYFIFASVGYELLRERREDRRRSLETAWETQQTFVPVARSLPVAARALPALQASYSTRTANVSRELEARPAEWALAPAETRAAAEFRAALRECFLSHPAATASDFERCWPRLRDEVFKRHTLHTLAALSLPPPRA